MREKIQRFMMGRYGNDNLNNCLVGTVLVLFILQIFLKNGLITIGAYVLWGISIYRMFSRNIFKRNQENVLFLSKTKGIRHQMSAIVKGFKDKNNHYYVCPSCGQIVRVPKGRGKIEITCPNCRSTFDRKS